MTKVTDYGKVAYDGYIDHDFMINNRQNDTWEELEEEERNNWRAAAKAVMEKNRGA